jgi:hypothetical protein
MGFEPTTSGHPCQVYGLISDTLPIAGLRRTPYLIIASSLGTVSWVLLGYVHTCTLPQGYKRDVCMRQGSGLCVVGAPGVCIFFRFSRS